MYLNKIVLLFLGFSISIPLWAADPNFDTESRIVTLPRVTVDETTAYSDVQLLLNPDGTWNILAFDQEPDSIFNLTGNWTGLVHSQSSFFPFCDIQIDLTLFQNGNELTGFGSLSKCVEDSGDIVGEITETNISFELISEKDFYSYSGSVSEDYRSLTLKSPRFFNPDYPAMWTLTLIDQNRL